ncbi:MAG: DUF3782 domain-containing protein [Ignisphaera sp.]|nr:DUF3782 domain-containing protein [Ignisphaera sp.]MCX8167634.1 DUF3782 domain-containing protein [Ignisphaera sp.]MDW8085955.1 DUF3782 domain-containing protein [Ignisphaera sp.]
MAEATKFLKGFSADYSKLLEDIKKIVRDAIEESKREDVAKLGEAMILMVTILKNMNEEMKLYREVLERYGEVLKGYDERFKKIEETLEEHTKVLKGYDERFKKIEFSLDEVRTSVEELKVSVGALSGRLGIDLERAILNLYRDTLKSFNIEGEKVEKISIKDTEGRYYRKGARLEMDIYIHDNVTYFIEVKSLVEDDDVEWFEERCRIFERILDRKPSRKIIVAVNIFKDAVERARELGIDVVYGKILEVETG